MIWSTSQHAASMSRDAGGSIHYSIYAYLLYPRCSTVELLLCLLLGGVGPWRNGYRGRTGEGAGGKAEGRGSEGAWFRPVTPLVEYCLVV